MKFSIFSIFLLFVSLLSASGSGLPLLNEQCPRVNQHMVLASSNPSPNSNSTSYHLQSNHVPEILVANRGALMQYQSSQYKSWFYKAFYKFIQSLQTGMNLGLRSSGELTDESTYELVYESAPADELVYESGPNSYQELMNESCENNLDV